MLGAEPADHLHEAATVRLELRLGPRAGDAAPSAHEAVEVGREGHPCQSPPAVGTEHQPTQVLLVDVTVRHRHRFPAVPAHHQERFGVRVGVEQGHLAADQLRVPVRPTHLLEEGHLLLDLAHGVTSVHANLIGVL